MSASDIQFIGYSDIDISLMTLENSKNDKNRNKVKTVPKTVAGLY